MHPLLRRLLASFLCTSVLATTLGAVEPACALELRDALMTTSASATSGAATVNRTSSDNVSSLDIGDGGGSPECMTEMTGASRPSTDEHPKPNAPTHGAGTCALLTNCVVVLPSLVQRASAPPTAPSTAPSARDSLRPTSPTFVPDSPPPKA